MVIILSGSIHQMNILQYSMQSKFFYSLYFHFDFQIHNKCWWDINFSPPLGRLESYLMNTKNGRFESKIIVTFILIGGDKMDEFLKSQYFRWNLIVFFSFLKLSRIFCFLTDEQHKNLLLDIAADKFDRFELVFLIGCYNFRWIQL